MKSTPVSLRIAALSLAASIGVFMASRALADDTTDRLVAAPWKITLQKGASIIRSFNKDGTFTTSGQPDQAGHWRVAGNNILQIYADGTKDVFTLPLSAKGTSGIARDGETLNAVAQTGTAETAPVATSTPPVAPQAPPPVVASGGNSAPAPQNNDPAALLISGPWKITAIGWGSTRVFAKDGTFSTVGVADPHGTWKVSANAIEITYSDGRNEIITLPLNPKGSAGADPNGKPTIYVLAEDSAASGPFAAPAVTPAPVAVVTPAPRPVPSATIAPPRTGATEPEAVKALLLSRPWRFLGSWWLAVRDFDKDGTFASEAGGDKGTWSVTPTAVLLTFPDGHNDSILLPLNADGSEGRDRGGALIDVTGGKPFATTSSAKIHSTSSLDYLKSTPAPGPADIARRNAAAATLLVGPWKITGRSWSLVRIFAKDGTFTTVGQAGEFGTWKIVGDKVNLVYKDSHIDTLDLPLDRKGTDGGDRLGIPTFAIFQADYGEATPAPTAASAGTTPFGTAATGNNPPPPRATPAPPVHQGPTPPPFGTALPPGE